MPKLRQTRIKVFQLQFVLIFVKSKLTHEFTWEQEGSVPLWTACYGKRTQKQPGTFW
jgi:hypothetical protein